MCASLQLTQIIADKEKKSSSYKESKLDALSDDKVAKIKKFSKEYIAKILHKMEKSGKKRNGSSSTHAGSSASAETPNSHGDIDGADTVMAEMTVEEAMDLGNDSGGDNDEEDEHQEENESPGHSPAHSGVHADLEDRAVEVWTATAGETFSSWDRDRGPTSSALSVGS
jgi:histone-lysine N-methyltransferase SETD2